MSAIDIASTVSETERAKPLARAGQAAGGTLTALNEALDACGVSTRSVAVAWGVTESIARGIRQGVRVLSSDRIDNLPRNVYVEFVRRLAAGVESEPIVVDVRRAHCRLVKATSRLATVATDAAEDGQVDKQEAAELLRAEREVVKTAAELVAAGRRVAK